MINRSYQITNSKWFCIEYECEETKIKVQECNDDTGLTIYYVKEKSERYAIAEKVYDIIKGFLK